MFLEGELISGGNGLFIYLRYLEGKDKIVNIIYFLIVTVTFLVNRDLIFI